MATPLEDLDRILESINATEGQRCFLRNYVAREGVTDIRYLGPRTREQEIFNLRISSVPGHVIQGTIGGRSVQVFVADNSNDDADPLFRYSDHVNIQAIQPNGRMEEYQSAFHTGTGAHYTVLYQDIEPTARGRRVSGRWSMTWNGEAQLSLTPNISPPDERHRRLNGYHACSVPIAANQRLQPLI